MLIKVMFGSGSISSLRVTRYRPTSYFVVGGWTNTAVLWQQLLPKYEPVVRSIGLKSGSLRFQLQTSAGNRTNHRRVASFAIGIYRSLYSCHTSLILARSLRACETSTVAAGVHSLLQILCNLRAAAFVTYFLPIFAKDVPKPRGAKLLSPASVFH